MIGETAMNEDEADDFPATLAEQEIDAPASDVSFDPTHLYVP